MTFAVTVTDECARLGLNAWLIESDEDVEILRQIRNACKDGFAHDNATISEPAQRAWWVLMHSRIKAWLYWHKADIVGYGLLRQTDDGRWWSSVAVVPQAAGHGYGGAITADLVRRTDEPVWAEARLDQPKAMRLHRVGDWEELRRDDALAYYRTRESVYDVILRDWSERGVIVT